MRDTEDEDAGRRLAFSRFVIRALEDAQTIRGWNNVRVASEASLGRATIDRWKAGRWRQDPEPASVNAFCEALGLNPEEAYRALRWGRYGEQPPPEPTSQLHPSVEALLRKLSDPNVPEEEKRDVLRTVEWLASRPAPPSGSPPRRNRRAG